jgi:hypothetical protein
MSPKPKAPVDGFRFLIQLIDAKNEKQVRAELKAMFGAEVATAALLTRGCSRMKKRSGPNKIEWEESPNGYRVFIPEKMSVKHKGT